MKAEALARRCRALKLLLSDVDGVMTDGRILFLPGGTEVRSFHVRDGLAVVLLFGLSSFLGWELGTPARDVLPADARGPNGYRSFHFWHSGFHGGK